MSEQERPEPTQTTPEGDEREKLGLPGEGGYEIPVPRRDTFMRNMEKVAPRAGEGVTQEAADSATASDVDDTREG